MRLVKKIILVFGFVILIAGNSSAQPVTWQRTYGGTGIQYGYAILQTPDGGYIAAGRRFTRIYVLRLNAYGDTVWTRDYPGFEATSVIRTLDNNYVILGAYSDVIKINEVGETIWIRSFGINILTKSIKEGKDGSLAICGISSMGSLRKPILLKLKSNGELIFLRQYLVNYLDGYFSDIEIDNKSEYIMCGNFSDSSSITDKFILLKTDSSGNQLWFYFYDFLQFNYPKAIINSLDSGFIIGGSTNRSFVMKFSQTGNYLWKRSYDSLNYSECRSIVSTNDNGYAFTGAWDSLSNSDIYLRLHKINKEGVVQWKKSFGFNNNDQGYHIIQTLDSGYAMIGIRDNFNNGDIYIVKTDKTGYANPIVGISKSYTAVPPSFFLYPNYPNPFNPITTITYQISSSSFVSLKVFDLVGNEIATLVNDNQASGKYEFKFDISNTKNSLAFSSGVYVYTLILNKKQKMSRRMIYIK